MHIGSLRTYSLPDVADHVIHFTGRTGGRTLGVDEAIRNMTPQARIMAILDGWRIKAFDTYSSGGVYTAFTESTKEAVLQLIREGRYAPWGIGFGKQMIFERGGGPVFYVRGDEWDATRAALPPELRTRMVRYWPGATADPGEWLTAPVESKSEWVHEREWRIRSDFVFGWDDVKFLIIGDGDWYVRQQALLEAYRGSDYARWFRQIPIVVIGADGRIIADPNALWH